MGAKKRFPTKVAVAVGAALLVLALAFVRWRSLTPEDPATNVAFSDFLTEVHEGKVETIEIKGRDYRYRALGPDGGVVFKKTIGPIADQSLVETLKPNDPKALLPKIYLEQ